MQKICIIADDRFEKVYACQLLEHILKDILDIVHKREGLFYLPQRELLPTNTQEDDDNF